MASKRHLRRKTCESKTKYDDKESARQGARWSWKKFKTYLVPYRCDFCGGYHLGHKRGTNEDLNPRQARRNRRF
jgi:hypothetical protein